MKNNNINTVSNSPFTMMGPIELRQPIPSQKIPRVDPFLLLHHYGPYSISKDQNPFELGAHPHRGFEPITFLIQGEQKHRDSLGNEQVIKSGGVQWITSGKGILHAEGPTKEFVEKSGELEGIQLWLNLPRSKKMMEPNYQQADLEQMEFVSFDGGRITVVAGEQKGSLGVIKTQTPVNAFWVDIKQGAETFIEIPSSHQSLVYLIKGEVEINNSQSLKYGEDAMVVFDQDGDGFQIKAKESSKLLVLSGEPIDEPVVMEGPFVMNSRRETYQAFIDYQEGKMGVL
ncbi:nuclease PIN [Wenyingzhuangia fucanilytica]|uniref:Nuclease PIN n=1 Tax=Wenyingzhuangia fucanilytica TaxID=1790137 RepID=A0A1B1Y718_9FLAO|nr:pirin family protein [Wenyingzhuangia fucanilytica]ANW96534.1 nuclease PIN [Wenyingzhuangia fucanilytica]